MLRRKKHFLRYLRISSSLGKTLKSASLRRTYEAKTKAQLIKLSWLPGRVKSQVILHIPSLGEVLHSSLWTLKGEEKKGILFSVVSSVHRTLNRSETCTSSLNSFNLQYYTTEILVPHNAAPEYKTTLWQVCSCNLDIVRYIFSKS